MAKQILRAENTNTWYKIDLDEDAKLKHIYVYDDYKNRHWWEKGVYFDYDLIIRESKELKKYTVLISYWDFSGKVLSCPDCALHKVWYILSVNIDNAFDERTTLRKAIYDTIPVIPLLATESFKHEIKKVIGYDPTIPDFDSPELTEI